MVQHIFIYHMMQLSTALYYCIDWDYDFCTKIQCPMHQVSGTIYYSEIQFISYFQNVTTLNSIMKSNNITGEFIILKKAM